MVAIFLGEAFNFWEIKNRQQQARGIACEEEQRTSLTPPCCSPPVSTSGCTSLLLPAAAQLPWVPTDRPLTVLVAMHIAVRVNSEDELSDWLGRNGFPVTQLGHHIVARAQEHILTAGCRVDARKGLLESAFVTLTLSEGRQRASGTSRRHTNERRQSTAIPAEVPRESWEQMDQINMEEVFLRRVPMLKSVPHFMRLLERANKFARGQWANLLEELCQSTCSSRIWLIRSKDSTQDAEQKRRGEAACNRVKQGQVSRTRQAFPGATLALGTLETLAELQRRRPQEQVREIPPEVMASNPTLVVLDPEVLQVQAGARTRC